MKIRKAVVLGSGVMGSQIATWLAAAGVRVHLLDLASDKLPDDPKLAKALKPYGRNVTAALALEKLKALKPSPITSPEVFNRIVVGNFDDDMSLIAEADWVIEAIIEKIEYKKPLLKKISEFHNGRTPITTNTSGIPLHKLCEDLSEQFQNCFFGTHFFNPPRYMKLLEIIPHPNTNLDLLHNVADWAEQRLGKGVVYANDTINFIANRIGVFNIQATLVAMQKHGLNIETVDALTGKLLGRPASATFRTMDVVGLDTFAHVAKNVLDFIKQDPYHAYFKMPAWVEELINNNHLGQKTKDIGCYKKTKNQKGATEILVYRPESKTYETQAPQNIVWIAEASKIPSLAKRLEFIFNQKDNAANFIKDITLETISYSAILLDEIASGLPKSLDDAMKWGFNWEVGPFELWQNLGYETVYSQIKDKVEKQNSNFSKAIEFYQPAPTSEDWQLNGPRQQWDLRKQKFVPIEKPDYKTSLPKSSQINDPRVVLKNTSASLLDIGDGIACLTFHSKMNTLNHEILDLCQKAVAVVGEQFAGLVVANDGAHFSAGADLKLILEYSKTKKFNEIDSLLRNFQGAMTLLKYSPFPVVTCPFGLTLGGGCEVALHGDYRIVNIETYAGLVEVGVGLIPGAGGCKELALRAYSLAGRGMNANPLPFLQKSFMLIGMGQTSTSGQEAIDMGLLDFATSEVSFSRERQVSQAKFKIMETLQRGYVSPTPAKTTVVGDPGIQTFRMMLYNMKEARQISAYDAFIGEQVATVLCGGEVDAKTQISEQVFLDLERRCFIELCKQEKTIERIEHMLKNGKPLRN